MNNNFFDDYASLPPQNINEPHQHVMFVCDRSYSMEGKALNNLLLAMNRFADDIRKDEKAARVIETSVIAFNGTPEVVQGWRSIEEMNRVSFTADGGTNISAALELAIDETRKRVNTIPTECHKPVIVLITDGFGGDVTEVAEKIQKRITDGKLQMWILCVEGYHRETVSKLCQRDKNGEPINIVELVDGVGYDFSQFFNLLSKSMKAVSVSSPGAKVHVDVTSEEVSNLKVPDIDKWLNS